MNKLLLAVVTLVAVVPLLQADDALATLLKDLQGGEESVRQRAAEGLGRLGKPAVAPVAALLGDKDADTRYYAVWALGLIGPDARDKAADVAKLLKDANEDVRRKALFSLGRIDPPPDVAKSGFLTALDDDSLDVRAAAAEAVAKMGPTMVPTLTEALKLPKARVRHHAAHALGLLKESASGAAEALGAALEDADEGVRFEAAEALARVGKTALPVLTKALNSERDTARMMAVRGLRGARATGALLDALKAKFPDVRGEAARALGELPKDDDRVVPALTRVLEKDEAATARAQAAGALRKFGDSAVPAVPALGRALGDDSPEVRQAAYAALEAVHPKPLTIAEEQLKSDDARLRVNTAATVVVHISPTHDAAMKILTEALKAKDAEIRLRAAVPLAQLQKEPAETLKVFLEGLKAPKASTREQAANSLGLVAGGAREAEAALISATKDSESTVRRAACLALARAGEPEAALRALSAAQKDMVVTVRQAALDAIWNRFRTDALTNYADALGDKDAAIRFRAIQCVSQSGPLARRLASSLLGLVKSDAEVRNRHAAAQALTFLGEDAVPALVEALAVDDVQVRISALTGLRTFGKSSKPAVSALAGLLRDKDDVVRSLAAQTLGAVGPDAKEAVAALEEVQKKDASAAVRQEAENALTLIRGK